MATEWKAKLKPVWILLAAYFFAPVVALELLGAHDTLFWHLTLSDLLQLGLAAALIYKFFSLKGPLTSELTAQLDKMGQTRERTLELSAKVSSSAEFILLAGLLLPPLSGMFPKNGLMAVFRYFAEGYSVYLIYVVWRLAEPFLSYVAPSAPEHEGEPGRQPVQPAGRCSNCGQLLDDSMKVCAFCRHPVP